MIKILSWIIVICIVLYIVGSLTIPFLALDLFPFFIGFVLVLGIISSIILILFLIIERIKDRKEEKDDLNKY